MRRKEEGVVQFGEGEISPKFEKELSDMEATMEEFAERIDSEI